MGREGRDYWEAQLSEYWDSGLTIQEYRELKELPYESTRRWIRVLQKARQDDVSDPESLELVEIKPLQTNASYNSGIRLLIDGIEIAGNLNFNTEQQPAVLFNHSDIIEPAEVILCRKTEPGSPEAAFFNRYAFTSSFFTIKFKTAVFRCF